MIKDFLTKNTEYNKQDCLNFINFINENAMPIDQKVLLKLMTQWAMRPRSVLDMLKSDFDLFAYKSHLSVFNLPVFHDSDFLSYLDSYEYIRRVKLFRNASNPESSSIPLFLSPIGKKYSTEAVRGLFNQYKNDGKGYSASIKYLQLHSFRSYAVDKILCKS